MKNYFKFPFDFNPDLLKQDLAKVAEDEWIKHFNQGYYEGNWSVASLRSIGGRTKQIYPDPNSTEPFADTEILSRCEYVREVLERIECEKQAVRFMLLGAGSKIIEHKDYFMGIEDDCVRLHLPVITNDKIEFYLADEQIKMSEGELWYLDFSQKHRVANNGDKDRIHLVIDCFPNKWFLDFLDKTAL